MKPSSSSLKCPPLPLVMAAADLEQINTDYDCIAIVPVYFVLW